MDIPVPLGHQKLRPGPGFGVSSETPFPRDTGSEFINNTAEIGREGEAHLHPLKRPQEKRQLFHASSNKKTVPQFMNT
jgi:hypothetical protein